MVVHPEMVYRLAVMEYEGLTFVTVRGAGHEVPLHRPEQALVLFQHFLQGEPMPAEVGTP